MNKLQWLKYFFLLSTLFIFLLSSINFIIDPLWTFSHSNIFNNAQPGFNERQQKTNRAYFGTINQYNALILGSSRTTYISQQDFHGVHAFNYAAGSMSPYEYGGWIEVAKKIKGAKFDYIFIGLDFFASSKNNYLINITAENYLKNSTAFLYRYKMLLSMDTLEKSLKSIIHSKLPDTIDYTRDNIKRTIKISGIRKQKAIDGDKKLFKSRYATNYQYNTDLKKIYRHLKKIILIQDL